MKQIQLLENELINKIAAGEVVERPASVVKELVENAADAGATQIEVEIQEGGISLISVRDNGSGIPAGQVKTAFLRHATSKLTTLEDLDAIYTMGFRGEALASIASVAQVEMVTKTGDSPMGYQICLDGGTILKDQPTGCANGTWVQVRNLFHNTPARRKFLKKPSTESGYVSDLMQKFALARPDIAFSYTNNKTLILQTSGHDNLQTAILQVFGKEIAKKMLPVKQVKEQLAVQGFVGKPEIARSNRSYEHFFINGRNIKSELVGAAVEDACKTKLTIGKFPFFVLHMKIEPHLVDVNVHPAKLEVRFQDEDLIYQAVLAAVKDAFAGENLIPETGWGPREPVIIPPVKQVEKKFPVLPLQVDPNFPPLTISDMDMGSNGSSTVVAETAVPYKIADVPAVPGKTYTKQIDTPEEKNTLPPPLPTKEPVPQKTEKTQLFFNQYTIIGQIFHTYWLIEQGQSMFLIDQHAAHERVLYEEIMAKLKKEPIATQPMLMPITLRISQKEADIIAKNQELLQAFGFEWEEFGRGEWALRGLPYIFNNPVSGDFFLEIVDSLGKLDGNPIILDNIYDTKLDAIATKACKAAVKGNDRLSYMEAKELVQKLVLLENPFTCPHGRPTIIEMTKYELEKKFKRIQ